MNRATTAPERDPTCRYAAHGQHLLLTLSGCAAQDLNDLTALVDLVERAASATGATILQVTSHQFSPQGVTALALLAESHASLHTYPEHRLAFWDCFTCGANCEPTRSIAILVAALQPTGIVQQVIER